MLPTFKKTDNGSWARARPRRLGITSRNPPFAVAVPRGFDRRRAVGHRSGSLITGNSVSKGEVQIDGEVQGDIHGTHIVDRRTGQDHRRYRC